MLGVLAGCGETRVTVVQPPPPTPLPEPPASPARTVPEVGDTIYVIKAFSAPSADGLYGFSLGRAVTLLAIEADMYLVSDGATKGRAHRTSFTLDADTASRLGNEADARLAQALSAARAQQDARAAAAPNPEQQKAELHRKQLAALRNDLAIVDEQIANIQQQLAEIAQSRNPRSGYTYYRSGEKRLIAGGSTPSTYALEENLRKLTTQRGALQQRLKHLERTGPGS